MDMRCWTVLAVLSASLTACRAGATGKEGEAGAGGQAGLDGTDGTDGTNGQDGESGSDGDNGADASADADADGIHWRQDCDDTDPAVGGPTVFWMDRDGDGYGLLSVENYLCEGTPGWVDNADDCDDTDASIRPDGTEICDGLDNNCDGLVDDDDSSVDLSTGVELYVDADEDGFGDDSTTAWACAERPGLSARAGDCDDGLDTINPEATEVCDNGVDDNCNGQLDACGVGGAIDATLTGSAGAFGDALSAAGDVDGDGFDDILIGDPADGTAAVAGGSAYLVYGSASLSDTDATTGTAWSFSLALGALGQSVAGVGDLDGDGFDDLALSTDGDGGVYVVYGGPSVVGADPAGGGLDLSLAGSTSRGFGASVHGLGELTGDAYDDFAISEADCGPGSVASGCLYLYSGSDSLASTLSDSDATAVFQGGSDGDAFATEDETATAGDWNGDGAIDLLIGAPGNSDSGSAAGHAYLWWGPVSAYSGLTTSGSAADADIEGQDSSGALGGAVASLGDFDEDGYEDLAVAASGVDEGAPGSGAVYVFLGSSSSLSPGLLPSDADLLYTADAAVQMGTSLAATDLTGDGHTELLIGGQGEGLAGAVWVFAGGPGVAGTATPATALALVEDSSSTGGAGSVLAVGDVNNDGIGDLLSGGSGEAVFVHLGGSW